MSNYQLQAAIANPNLVHQLECFMDYGEMKFLDSWISTIKERSRFLDIGHQAEKDLEKLHESTLENDITKKNLEKIILGAKYACTLLPKDVGELKPLIPFQDRIRFTHPKLLEDLDIFLSPSEMQKLDRLAVNKPLGYFKALAEDITNEPSICLNRLREDLHIAPDEVKNMKKLGKLVSKYGMILHQDLKSPYVYQEEMKRKHPDIFNELSRELGCSSLACRKLATLDAKVAAGDRSYFVDLYSKATIIEKMSIYDYDTSSDDPLGRKREARILHLCSKYGLALLPKPFNFMSIVEGINPDVVKILKRYMTPYELQAWDEVVHANNVKYFQRLLSEAKERLKDSQLDYDEESSTPSDPWGRKSAAELMIAKARYGLICRQVSDGNLGIATTYL